MKLAYLILLSLIISACSSVRQISVPMGEDKVYIQITSIGHGKTFVHVHHNEQTAVKAAKTVIREQGGTLITLLHPGQRNIRFHLDGKRYEFDPNRIYTNRGIRKTLKQNGPYSQKAHYYVQRLALRIKTLLPSGKVIAVHNNRHYSLKAYLPGRELHNTAKALSMPNRRGFRNFYLLTRLDDFKRLKKLKFNGVLQSKRAEDDGSLSIYLQERQYINVEAAYDQLQLQIKMLKNA